METSRQARSEKAHGQRLGFGHDINLGDFAQNYLVMSTTTDSVKAASTESPTANRERSTLFLTLTVFFFPSGSSSVTLCFWLSMARIFPLIATVSTTTAPGFDPRGATLTAPTLAAAGLSPGLFTATISSSVAVNFT